MLLVPEIRCKKGDGLFFMDLQSLYQYRYLVWVLVERDIKKKYRRSVLGVLWSLLNPLMMMSITAMVFSTLFRFDIQNYVLYLLIGQVIFTFYVESTSFAMGSIMENGSLLRKVSVPKYLFPMSRVISSCVNLLFTLPAVLLIMLCTGQIPNLSLVSFLLPLACMLLFCFGVGLILSAVVVRFRDMGHLYGVLITALNYATPIFYPDTIVPERYRFILELNPLYYFLKAFRSIVCNGTVPEPGLLAACCGLAIAFMLVGMYVFNKNENEFINYI